jgi:hypothetical protein
MHHPTRAGEPGGETAVELVGVGALDPLRDVGECENAEEVDVDRRPAFLGRVVQQAPQERGLPVAPWRSSSPASRSRPSSSSTGSGSL